MLVVALGGVALVGCAADDVSANAPADDGAEVDELNSSSLRASTAMKGSVAAGGTLTLQYDREDAEYPRKIPYLAVEIVAAPATHAQSADPGALHALGGGTVGGAGQSISVEGDFPSTPQAVLVDGNFKVLARAAGVTQPDGSDRIDLQASREANRRFLLIRDTRWSKPMSFRVKVGQ